MGVGKRGLYRAHTLALRHQSILMCGGEERTERWENSSIGRKVLIESVTSDP